MAFFSCHCLGEEGGGINASTLKDRRLMTDTSSDGVKDGVPCTSDNAVIASS